MRQKPWHLVQSTKDRVLSIQLCPPELAFDAVVILSLSLSLSLVGEIQTDKTMASLPVADDEWRSLTGGDDSGSLYV